LAILFIFYASQIRPHHFRTTEKERQKVLEYKAQGYSNNWIAHKLGRSHTLINNIVKRMNIKTAGNGQKRRRSKKMESEDEEEEEEDEEEMEEDEEETEDEQPAKRKYALRNYSVKGKTTNDEKEPTIHENDGIIVWNYLIDVLELF